MLSEENISISHYLSLGLRLIVLSIVSMIFYNLFFLESISNTKSYIEDKCTIKSIELIDVNFECFENDMKSVAIVRLPCIVIKVNTKNYENILFYRNYDEKMFALSQNEKVYEFKISN